MDMILSGKMIDAREALQIGLVNKVVPRTELRTVCEGFAQEMAANGPLALEYAIEAINKGLEIPLDDALLLEAELFGKACATEDSKEGTKAFLQKRRAHFQGK